MQVRVGIDVGGTFTHGVALSVEDGSLVAQAKVPTTHAAEEGVARGVVEALDRLMEEAGIEPGDVVWVAHSTTQATNALLEGDVSPVGILAVGSGLEGARVRAETHLDEIVLAPGKSLRHHQLFLEQADDFPEEERLREALGTLAGLGAEAIVAATAFSVDEPETERRVVAVAQDMGLVATATHEISQLYGLRVRTRTAAINAAILPRMIRTAESTEAAVRERGIEAPLVVMRSDGGAMDIQEMKRRPVLTLLSGPAAGVAAALMAGGIADGIFMEVGGTSTDVSCIQDGRPHHKMAQVGSHRLYLNTLDVRTVGVAGGSMARVGPLKSVKCVGPRSAHIAGLRYAAFPGERGLPEGVAPRKVAPLPGDPEEYLALLGAEGEPGFALTPACAANLLGHVPEGDYAEGDREAVGEAFSRAARFLEAEPEELAGEIMEKGGEPLSETVVELAEEYGLSRERVRLVGGGGGAGVWVPFLAERLEVPVSLIDHAPVISAIGAAVALIQETLERTLLDPTPEDLAALRDEAEAAVVRSGAAPETVEVRVEVDRQRGVLRAVAVGSHPMAAREETLDDHSLAMRAAELLGADQAELAARTEGFAIFRSTVTRSSFFGFVRTERHPWRVLDRRGRARVGADHGEVVVSSGERLVVDLEELVDRHASYGDAGRILPAVHVVLGQRTVDLSGLADLEQMRALCEEEARRLQEDEVAVLVVRLV